ncbi:uncharacterized protein [Dysidea avara]|uniref:uncharacterized protein isoform X2 n=1 Tax=Dysidea avara TaxID=196820 RepID=UPI003323D83D
MDDEEDTIMMNYHPHTGTGHPSNHVTTTNKPDCLYGPQVINVITRRPEFSFLIRYYDLLYQSLIPNCKLTIKTLKQHIEIPSDVESFIVNGESSRIRCQRIINLLLVQLDTTRDYKYFCYLFNMISVMTDLPDKLRTEFHHTPYWDDDITQYHHTNNNGSDVNSSLPYEPAVERIDPPIRIVLNKDFTLLKTHYHTILQLMPDKYEQSVGKLQNYISDYQICMILSSSNSTTANKIILDCLIERMSCREELLDLCDQLETITTSHQLMIVISEIRSDVQQSIRFPTSIPSATNIQSLSSDQQHHSTSPSVNGQLYQISFSKMKLSPSSRVLPVLKKNYTRLCHCLPQDYVKTVDKLKQLIPGLPADDLNQLRTLPSIELINQTIMGIVLCIIVADDDVFVFCDTVENLCDESTSKNFIEAFRNELLEALCSPPSTTTTTNTSLPFSSSSGSHHPTALHQTLNDSSVSVGSNPVISTPEPVVSPQHTQSNEPSRVALQEQLNYEHQRIGKDIKCPPPPPLPPNYVPRQHLLEEMVSKLCQSTIDPNSYGTSLTVTGAGGYGKTSLATALCYHPVIKEKFTDGVVFIELGPQATDPSMKLSQLYHLLTGQYLKQGDINHAEQEISQLTSLYCRNLLVIIDDVWHVEDAEPIVKAFNNCKIVLTTRMNDIEQYVPTKQVVSVGPMEQSEAISLLTCGVIDISQLSREDVSLLEELAHDVHLWPLLLSLIRGQLFHNLKQHKSRYHEAIQFVQTNLHNKGLTAFDKNNIGRSRKYAVKVCIEVTLELLTKSLTNKIKTLILWTGIGTSLQTAVLHNLWNITKYEARNFVDVLWAYGLVQLTDIIIPPQNNTQNSVQVHAVISQYIIECMESKEVIALSPFVGSNTGKLVSKGLIEQFQKSSGINDTSSLPVCSSDYLKYEISAINYSLSIKIKMINMMTIADPHYTIEILQHIQSALITSISITTFFPTIIDEIKSLISDCHKIIKDAHRMSRKLNQNVQRCLTQRNYQNLIQTIETYNNTYPLALIAQQALSMVKKTIPYCDGELLNYVMMRYEWLYTMIPDYHRITLMILPYVKLSTKDLQLIYTSLQTGSPDVEATKQYFLSGQDRQEYQLVETNYYIKLKEVAPHLE